MRLVLQGRISFTKFAWSTARKATIRVVESACPAQASVNPAPARISASSAIWARICRMKGAWTNAKMDSSVMQKLENVGLAALKVPTLTMAFANSVVRKATCTVIRAVFSSAAKHSS